MRAALVLLLASLVALTACESNQQDVVSRTNTETTVEAANSTVPSAPVDLRWGVGACAQLVNESVSLVTCDSPSADLAIEGSSDATDVDLSVEDVEQLQQILSETGFDPGPLDGLMGPRTLSATESAAESLGLAVEAAPHVVLSALRGSSEATHTLRNSPALCGRLPFVETGGDVYCLTPIVDGGAAEEADALQSLLGDLAKTPITTAGARPLPPATTASPPPTRSKSTTTAPIPTPPVIAPASCHPSYSPCIPPSSDYDCIGGSGNGPSYTGRVAVIGTDVYGLDRDGDGIGCE